MRVQLSILLFVGLFVGLLSVKYPGRCPSIDTEGVKCPNVHDDLYSSFRVPGKCSKVVRCHNGCPVAKYWCTGCMPFNRYTKRCMHTGPKCDQCVD